MMRTSIELLSQAIKDLSDISKGLNADFIKQQGLIKASERRSTAHTSDRFVRRMMYSLYRRSHIHGCKKRIDHFHV